MESEMQAYVLESSGDDIKGGVRPFDTGQLPEDGVTIRVEYSGINFKDAMIARGGRQRPLPARGHGAGDRAIWAWPISEASPNTPACPPIGWCPSPLA